MKLKIYHPWMLLTTLLLIANAFAISYTSTKSKFFGPEITISLCLMIIFFFMVIVSELQKPLTKPVMTSATYFMVACDRSFKFISKQARKLVPSKKITNA